MNSRDISPSEAKLAAWHVKGVCSGTGSGSWPVAGSGITDPAAGMLEDYSSEAWSYGPSGCRDSQFEEVGVEKLRTARDSVSLLRRIVAKSEKGKAVLGPGAVPQGRPVSCRLQIACPIVAPHGNQAEEQLSVVGGNDDVKK
jgi:hypothetical protein